VIRRSAWHLLWRKLSGGAGAYEGLWELIGATYQALAAGRIPPISLEHMLEVNTLVHELKNEANQF